MEQESIQKQLKDVGFRMTEPRRAVIQVLQEAGGWLTPEQILENASGCCPSLGLATVYRTLNLLSDKGFVRRIHFEDGCHGYARADLDHGHHLICRACHEVVEFEGLENIESFIESVESQTGYQVDDHLLELVGLCPGCQ